MPSPILSSHPTRATTGRDIPDVNSSTQAEVVGSTPTTPMMAASSTTLQREEYKEGSNALHRVMDSVGTATQLLTEDRNFLQHRSNQFIQDFNENVGQHPRLERKTREIITDVNSHIENVDSKLKKVNKLRKAVLEGSINPEYAQQIIAKYTPKQSSTSQYGQVHIIGLKAGELPEKALELRMAARSFLSSKKEVPSTENLLDITQRQNHSSTMNAHLQSIPVNDDAVKDGVKPTKILLMGHGSEDELSADSPIDEWTHTSPEDVAMILRKQLKPGNYHNTLTIAVNACDAGKTNKEGVSVVDRIASTLKANGCLGIRVTGLNAKFAPVYSSNYQHQIGNDVVQTGKDLTKYSQTGAKQIAYTDDK